ncbi:hypothetical protein ASPZODRAFT_148590 [Penicilliopsis zonata CBS 506.65]|uniref:alpha-amylase n=1 Tax=Penicilliopsis zonata CBS 506.65 TaxID=1073090 RepID=A0A1L9SVP8_9EURO|nr:hypothetical protein ASPZODRAFT_148590 [Penicilliopsis zonata CBS 506.65]OJJ51285.1 hypothetical protein ASPZODRAFT_148590 [Penicilliopsis zonata CBS 506.65]
MLVSVGPRHAAQWGSVAIGVTDLLGSASAAGTDSWKTRSIYQTMTDRFARSDGSTTSPCNTTAGLYCGGTWRGLINQLDYIQGMGFDAVMISPIIENIVGEVSYGEAYHGYWPLDLYSLNSHFGTHQDLLDLSSALHNRSMYLMMDTVINNMAYITNGSDPATDVNYSVFTPFNSSGYFHPYCEITDYNNYSLAQRCWTGDDIVPLPDLKTEDSTVQSLLESWVEEVMSTYSIDGIRLDAAKHVTPDFLPRFHSATNNTFMTGEVYDSSVDVICNYQNNYLPSVPNYPIYFALLKAFTQGNTSALTNEITVMKRACNDVTALASFSENHDVTRFASLTDDLALAKNVVTFTLLFDGVPLIYQGQEQHFKGSATPENREALWLSGYNTTAPLYQLIAKLNRLRQHIFAIDPEYIAEQSYPIFTGGSEIGIHKGIDGRQVIMILSTQGTASTAYTFNIPVTYAPGVVAMDILNCVNYTVDVNGNLDMFMDKGEPRVLYPVQFMPGSGFWVVDLGYEKFLYHIMF